jgi:hypothetical protein
VSAAPDHYPGWAASPASGPTASPDHHSGWAASPASGPIASPALGLAALLEAADAAVGCLADGADLRDMADRDAAAVMGTLTTLVGRLDALRVGVARAVRIRDIAGLRGTRTLAGWLRADARLADDAWKIQRLATMGPHLPRITALLSSGTVSLAQAATACWQISQLPHLPVPPATAEPTGRSADSADAEGTADPQHGTPDPSKDDRPDGTDGGHEADHDGQGSCSDGSCSDGSGSSGDGPGSPGDGPPGTGTDPAHPAGQGAEDAWAGLWRAGDVHAAADELFAAFLPGLDGSQLRQLGAHLREAASPEQRAREDRDDYAARSLRITRSFGGNGEISGRLHPEAAEQVIAAFEELAARTGPDDKRTKAQRWADALARLTATTPDLHPAPAATPDSASQADPPDAQPVGDRGDEDDDQPGEADPGTGHDHHAEADRRTASDGTADGTAHDGTAHDGTAHDGTAHDGTAHDGTAHDGTAHDGTADGGTADSASDRDGSADPHGGLSGTVPAGYRRPRVIVTVPLPTLLGQPLSPGATLGHGTPLTAETARRLACDAEVIRLITSPHPPDTGPGQDATAGQDGTAQLTARLAAALAQLPPPLATPSAVLDIGRKSPGWTPRQRDALYAQYGGHCSAPRCSGRIDVIHHIRHWLYGGKTQIINGCPFCDYHHWLVHEGGWFARRLPDGTITLHRQPPGWRLGTIYRRGQPVTE